MKDIQSFVVIWRQFQRILSKKQKVLAVIVFVMSLIGAFFEVLGVSVFLPFVQVMVEPTQLFGLPFVGEICESINRKSQHSLMYVVAMCLMLVYIVKNVYLTFLSWVRVKFSVKVQRELSIRMFNSYANRGYSFFRQTNMSVLIRGANSSVLTVNGVLYAFMKIISEVMTILCILMFILITDFEMAVSLAGLIGLCIVCLLSLFKRIIKRAGEIYHKGVAEVNKWTLQLFSGIKEILVLNRKEYFIKNYEQAHLYRQKGQIKQTVFEEVPAYVIEGVCVVGIIVSVCVRMISIEDPSIFIAKLGVFAVAAFRILPSVGRISSNLNVCMFGLPSVREVYNNFVDAENNYIDDSCRTEINKQNVIFEDKLCVNNVSWRYPDGKEDVLKNIDISICKGESVAFVGPSGAGKSTLADIILGLLVPQSGQVTIDGNSIENKRSGLAKVMSFVPQAVYLIDDTIRKNVAFGINEYDIDDNAIWEALEKAQLDIYIKGLPDQLDTVVGERGVRFSGGQVQRLAIARALYTNPSILVLDEATSALDGETEKAVMDAIESLQGKITLIIIAHRLSTIKNCDTIYEINNGKAYKRVYEELIQGKVEN